MTNDELVSRIEALLFVADPIGINFETNTDEYLPEAEIIVRRLGEVSTVDHLVRVVHEVFVRMFDRDTAGAADSYRGIAGSIWGVWKTDTAGDAI